MSYNYDKDLSTKRYTVEIDTAADYGYFEHKLRGDEGGTGGLWFGKDGPNGMVELIDYDGVFELPKEIIVALREAGYFLDAVFDQD